MRILIVYAFCTFGGVERVVLNRMEAFRKYRLDVRIDMVFLHDLGGLKSFEKYIKSSGLSNCINLHVFNGDFSQGFALNDYDMLFIIDTPSVFSHLKGCRNFYVECHTPYAENRSYLKSLPDNVRGIIVPSEAFRKEIAPEVGQGKDIFVLPNTVADIFLDFSSGGHYPFFSRRPLAYMARLDDLKNIEEALKIFEGCGRRDVMFIVIGKGATDKDFVLKLNRLGLLGRCFLKEKIDFKRVPGFFATLRKHKGIFLSPSRGESFGMAVAESITSAVPVLVSDIPAHRELVASNSHFLYALGNVSQAEEKVSAILDEWDRCVESISIGRDKFDHSNFVKAWRRFISREDCGPLKGMAS